MPSSRSSLKMGCRGSGIGGSGGPRCSRITAGKPPPLRLRCSAVKKMAINGMAMSTRRSETRAIMRNYLKTLQLMLLVKHIRTGITKRTDEPFKMINLMITKRGEKDRSREMRQGKWSLDLARR